MCHIKKIAHLCFLIALINSPVTFATTKILIWEHTVNDPTEIIMDTLYRALEITKPEYGDYELVTSVKMEQGRALRELSKLNNSLLDLAHFAPTRDR